MFSSSKSPELPYFPGPPEVAEEEKVRKSSLFSSSMFRRSKTPESRSKTPEPTTLPEPTPPAEASEETEETEEEKVGKREKLGALLHVPNKNYHQA